MQHLVLFVSEGESGAPGYLSQLGEDGASNLAETLSQFMGNLGLTVGKRGQGLTAVEGGIEDWHRALEIESRAAVFSARGTRSRKTTEIWASHLGLPVVYDKRLGDSDAPLADLESAVAEVCRISQFLGALFSQAGEQEALALPPLLILQTPLFHILNWAKGQAPDNLWESIKESLTQASETDRIPTLLATGYEGPWPGTWIFDRQD